MNCVRAIRGRAQMPTRQPSWRSSAGRGRPNWSRVLFKMIRFTNPGEGWKQPLLIKVAWPFSVTKSWIPKKWTKTARLWRILRLDSAVPSHKDPPSSSANLSRQAISSIKQSKILLKKQWLLVKMTRNWVKKVRKKLQRWLSRGRATTSIPIGHHSKKKIWCGPSVNQLSSHRQRWTPSCWSSPPSRSSRAGTSARTTWWWVRTLPKRIGWRQTR